MTLPSARADDQKLPGMLVFSDRGRAFMSPQFGASTTPYPNDFGSEAMADHFLEYWRIILKRRWIAIGFAAASVTVIMAITLLMTPMYTATTTIQIDRQTIQITKDKVDSVLPTQEDQDFVQTQYELLKSRALAERVVDNLSLQSDREFLGYSPLAFLKSAFARSTGDGPVGSLVSRAAAVSLVMANIGVDPVRGTRLVRVSFTSPSPSIAQRIANATADAFLSSNLDRRLSANAYAKNFLQDQLQQMQLKVEESERKLVEFATREQIISVGQGGTSLTDTNLSISNQALVTARSKRIEAEQIWKQAEEAKGFALPQISGNLVIQTKLQQRAQLSADYQDRLSTFKPSYPSMLQLKGRIDELDRQLRADTETIKDGLKASYKLLLNEENGIALQVAELKAETLDLQRRGIQYGILKREADTNHSIYDGLLQRYKEIGVTGGVGANNLSVVDAAQQPSTPSSPHVLINLAVSVGIGLVGGIAGALLTEVMDGSIKSAEDVEHATKVVTLGVVPRLLASQSLTEALADTRSSFSEAYRSLCTNLQFSTDSGVPSSLLVTSARPSEGKSATARIIATHFAGMDFKVLLIDCDLRNPSQHEALGLDNSLGLSNYLIGACDAQKAVQATQVPNFSIILSGPLPPNPTQLLGSKRFTSLLSDARAYCDLIILDGPPVMGLADAPLISSVAAGTLLVAAAGHTNVAAVRNAFRRLQFARAAIIGTLVTKFDIRNVTYGYQYGYASGYDQDDYLAYGAVEPAATLIEAA